MQFNIYKLTCNKTGQVYYGSTKKTPKRRLQSHKSKYKKYTEEKTKEYCSSYEILKNNDYKIELLETCFNVYHMIERETFYFDNYECVNRYRPCMPGHTKKEWDEENKEKMKEYWKEYHIKNKEKIAEKDKARYEKNKETILEKKKEKYSCECGSRDITLRQKARHERSIKHQNYLKNLNS